MGGDTKPTTAFGVDFPGVEDSEEVTVESGLGRITSPGLSTVPMH